MTPTKRSTDTGSTPASKKRRSFTGCYTCRKRKVKCDNKRPTCDRCAKSRVPCLGYGINLQWAKVLSVQEGRMIESSKGGEPEMNSDTMKRRHLSFVKLKKLYCYEDELDADLGHCTPLNIWKAGKTHLTKGPFGIFKGEYFGVRSGESAGRFASISRYGITSQNSELRSTYPPAHTMGNRTYTSYSGDSKDSDDDDDEDTIEVWIDERFLPEARATFSLLINNYTKFSPQDSYKVIFAKYFELENPTMIDTLLQNYRPNSKQLYGLIKERVEVDGNFGQVLKYFVDHVHMMMPITFKGNIYETLVIPLIYQHLGSIIVDPYHEGAELKRLAIKQVLCLGCFLKYESTKNSKYLKDSIELRQDIMLDLTSMIIRVTNRNNEFVRNKYVENLITNYDIKNVVLVLILMIKIDYHMQILENFSTWFKLMDNLILFLNNYNDSILNSLNAKDFNEKLTLDKFVNLKKLIKLYRFIKVFYFSTAKIDFDNYELGTEVSEFEDILNDGYDLTKGDFIFDDGFNKIDDYLDILINKPQMINAEDKPTFTINFNGNKESDSENDDDSDDDSEEETAKGANKAAEVVLIDIPQPDNGTVFIGDVDDDVKKFSSIEYMYGLPLSLLELFNKIITLTNHKNYFTRRKLFPRNYPKLCCELEEDLQNWRLTWRLFDDKQRYKSVFHEILYHNILSFYNSMCIYFERIIKESDPSLVQGYVRNSLKHLMKLIEIDALETRITPLFWSFFISSSDAIDLDLQYEFWEISDKFAGNNWISKQVILEVWKKRNEGFHQVCWLDIVKNWDCDVLLLC